MKILILGKLPETEEQFLVYQSIKGACNSNEVSSPIETKEFKGSNEERYTRAFQKVHEADLILAELSNPSTGQGIELRQTTLEEKPVIVIVKGGSKLSGLVKGMPNLKAIVYYNNIEELKEKIKKEINQ